jgi:hypothetical protein
MGTCNTHSNYLYCANQFTQAVKLTALLAQYLYTNHRLDLPGIGTFLLDPTVISSAVENTKQPLSEIEGISFENNALLKDTPDLIAFISSQTGKMKALANADLESHIQLAQQLLNLGKPFTFEGIGILVKKKNGVFEFTPLSMPPEKIKEYKAKETTSQVTLEESSAKYESFLSSPKTSLGWRRPAVALLVLAGIALAIWGGYTISKKAATSDTTEVTDAPPPPPPVDSSALQPVIVKKQDYKYILQVSKRQTALRRYNQLKTNLWDVQMETQDSVLFKLYMLLPAMNADTTRVLDSLTAMTGKKVYIEHQN